MRRHILIALFFIITFGASPVCVQAQTKMKSDDIVGLWYTQDKDGGVEIYACGDKICGRFYWLDQKPGDSPMLDEKNADPTLRRRDLCRTQFMGDFTPDAMNDGRRHYSDGWIYSPRHGYNFQAEMTLIDHNTLDLHGYVLTPILGESQTWTRAESMPQCTGLTAKPRKDKP